MSTRDPITHIEMQDINSTGKLNWLRAAVLGANDGIVSVSSVIVGVAGASSNLRYILTAGVAAMVAGALSMSAGEYVSVSTQRDSERALLDKERQELKDMPERELEELTQIYHGKGLSRATAEVVARELTAHDAFAAHVDAELNIDPNDLTNPWHAAYASALAFLFGATIPVIATIVTPEAWRIQAIFASVIVALVITGALSAHSGGSSKRVAAVRVVVGGVLAMLITYGVGKIFGVSGL